MEDKTKELRGQQGEEIANSKNRMNKIIEKGTSNHPPAGVWNPGSNGERQG